MPLPVYMFPMGVLYNVSRLGNVRAVAFFLFGYISRNNQ